LFLFSRSVAARLLLGFSSQRLVTGEPSAVFDLRKNGWKKWGQYRGRGAAEGRKAMSEF